MVLVRPPGASGLLTLMTRGPCRCRRGRSHGGHFFDRGHLLYGDHLLHGVLHWSFIRVGGAVGPLHGVVGRGRKVLSKTGGMSSVLSSFFFFSVVITVSYL